MAEVTKIQLKNKPCKTEQYSNVEKIMNLGNGMSFANCLNSLHKQPADALYASKQVYRLFILYTRDRYRLEVNSPNEDGECRHVWREVFNSTDRLCNCSCPSSRVHWRR